MQTHEATFHRVDAELAAGLPISPIASNVAADALDHAVDVMWGWLPDGATYVARAIVEFVATDVDRRWLVRSRRCERQASCGAGDGGGADRDSQRVG